ncbi:uncharacterized protein LOC104896317 [Beta vulgaris subsp. vulgaris]|uniref:uncharacterized protein LOC104896317 n=1 Tax=Beta vulgaris subsp. vulgaris TaxID=3555 RepID=UPI0020370C6A|nr:uncharacterized protein LOC104896317 [Beta vulgaris subsp. vulgaris]
MYTTKPLSLYKDSPEAISLPPEGPNSAYLVVEDAKSTPTTCDMCLCTPSIKEMPFPQNKLLQLAIYHDTGDLPYYSYYTLYLIPVINQPLSSNRYYAIKTDGRHKGKAYASAKEEDIGTCCFCFQSIPDIKPRTFDPEDIYQQFEFSMKRTCNSQVLVAKSVAPDGHPPSILRIEGWIMSVVSQNNFTLGEAQGIDSSLRAHLPNFDFLSSEACSKSVVVGKWYCPFMFIKEGREKDQLKKSMFYEMTLEQRWERIFAAERSNSEGKLVTVDVMVPTEMVRIAGQEAAQEERNDDRKMMMFKTIVDGKVMEVGLSSLIVERLVWEEERVGWVNVNEKDKRIRVVKDAEYASVGDWRSFGCYLLVETFVLKTNYGSIVLTYDFKHTHQIRSKWE